MSINIRVIVSEADAFREDKDISFLNYASFYDLWNKNKVLLGEVSYCCDGILMSSLTSFLTGSDVQRLSFDLTSLANSVFTRAVALGQSIAIIGATEQENEVFVKKMKARYPGIIVPINHSGYFDTKCKKMLYEEIIKSDIDICVIGLGALKQEEFIVGLRDAGYLGISFSCGGFIRQEATTEKAYYPVIINKLNIRWIYRMCKEPHTIKRYLLTYPKSLWKIIRLSKSREINFVT